VTANCPCSRTSLSLFGSRPISASYG